MKPSRFTEEQIIEILREEEDGRRVPQTRDQQRDFYKWKAKYGGLVSDADRLTRRCR